MTHTLKTIQPYYSKVESGEKTFEIRRNDRPFKVGDTLILQEYIALTKTYTGEEVKKKITYIFNGSSDFGMYTDFVILAIKEIEKS